MKGQARKSLWIETARLNQLPVFYSGQARKSLWIETSGQRILRQGIYGQARKSLWIETAIFSPFPTFRWWSGS